MPSLLAFNAVIARALALVLGAVKAPLVDRERAAAVILKKVWPGMAARWGQGKPGGLRTGLVVAAQHAAWGAEMAANAGAEERVVWLIRHHQDDPPPQMEDTGLLLILQEVDAAS